MNRNLKPRLNLVLYNITRKQEKATRLSIHLQKTATTLLALQLNSCVQLKLQKSLTENEIGGKIEKDQGKGKF